MTNKQRKVVMREKISSKIRLEIKIEELIKITEYLNDLNLTDKQRLFCWYYVFNGHDRAEAARSAGYGIGNRKNIKDIKTIF